MQVSIWVGSGQVDFLLTVALPTHTVCNIAASARELVIGSKIVHHLCWQVSVPSVITNTVTVPALPQPAHAPDATEVDTDTVQVC